MCCRRTGAHSAPQRYSDMRCQCGMLFAWCVYVHVRGHQTTCGQCAYWSLVLLTVYGVCMGICTLRFSSLRVHDACVLQGDTVPATSVVEESADATNAEPQWNSDGTIDLTVSMATALGLLITPYALSPNDTPDAVESPQAVQERTAARRAAKRRERALLDAATLEVTPPVSGVDEAKKLPPPVAPRYDTRM